MLHLIKLVFCSGGCRRTRGPLLTNNRVNKLQKDKADLLSAQPAIAQGVPKRHQALGRRPWLPRLSQPLTDFERFLITRTLSFFICKTRQSFSVAVKLARSSWAAGVRSHCPPSFNPSWKALNKIDCSYKNKQTTTTTTKNEGKAPYLL